MARAEDSTVNLLIVDRPQILDIGWSRRLNVSRRDVGTGMTAGEVDELSAQVHLPSLMEYWHAVGTRTADVVDSLSPADLDGIVDPDRVHRLVAQTAAEPARVGLEWIGDENERLRAALSRRPRQRVDPPDSDHSWNAPNRAARRRSERERRRQ